MDAIVLEHVYKRYGTVEAIRDVSLTIAPGEIFGFLGSNGAGKSTLIRCMLDVLRPSSGSIVLLGQDAHTAARSIHQSLGYLPGEVRFSGAYTGQQLISLFSSLQSVSPSFLSHLQKVFPLPLQRKVRTYSKGMRQQLGILLACMSMPRLLILDEPTSGLDPLLQHAFHDVLRELQQHGSTIFMSSHVLSDVEKVCSRIALLRKGELVTLSSVEDMRAHAGYTFLVIPTDGTDRHVLTTAVQQLSGVSSMTESESGTLSFHLQGDMQPCLHLLGQYPITKLLIQEVSLEDVILESYGVALHSESTDSKKV